MRSAGGLYYRDWAKPIAEAIVNLVSSIMLLRRFGIAGVFMGTIISSLLVGTWVEAYIVHKDMLKSGLGEYVRQYLIYVVSAAVAGVVAYLLTGLISGAGFAALLLRACVCFASVNAVFVLLYLRSEHLAFYKNLVLRIVKK